jgi:hypothetical protein
MWAEARLMPALWSGTGAISTAASAGRRPGPAISSLTCPRPRRRTSLASTSSIRRDVRHLPAWLNAVRSARRLGGYFRVIEAGPPPLLSGVLTYFRSGSVPRLCRLRFGLQTGRYRDDDVVFTVFTLITEAYPLYLITCQSIRRQPGIPFSNMLVADLSMICSSRGCEIAPSPV